jgi:ABC-type uncharacterized transport system permease subunit
MIKLIALGSIIAYGVNTACLVKQFNTQKKARFPLAFGWLAASFHTLYIGLLCAEHNGFSFSFSSVASLNILGVVLVLLLTALSKPVEKLGIVLFPLAAILLLIDVSFQMTPRSLSVHTGSMAVHIVTSVVAFSLLSVAAMQALLLVFQHNRLKKHPPSRFILLLPSLQTMETLLFQMILAGVLVLSLSLCTGFLFLHDLFAQHLAHKTVLALLAWGIFLSILIGRKYHGWRGRLAVNWILAGFMLLLLSYFGSKFVLELILRY